MLSPLTEAQLRIENKMLDRLHGLDDELLERTFRDATRRLYRLSTADRRIADELMMVVSFAGDVLGERRGFAYVEAIDDAIADECGV